MSMNQQNDVQHYVDPEPFNPAVTEELTAEQERYYQASQWQIMWWKFKRHKVAVWSGVILLLFYLCVPFAEQIAPYTPNARDNGHLYAPPQLPHLFHEGEFVGPFVYPLKRTMNLDTGQREYAVNKTKPMPLSFFCSGEKYNWLLSFAQRHLCCLRLELAFVYVETNLTHKNKQFLDWLLLVHSCLPFFVSLWYHQLACLLNVVQ